MHFLSKQETGSVPIFHDHIGRDSSLRGSAVDLLLAILRRRPIADTGVTVFGDETVWQNWLDRTPL